MYALLRIGEKIYSNEFVVKMGALLTMSMHLDADTTALMLRQRLRRVLVPYVLLVIHVSNDNLRSERPVNRTLVCDLLKAAHCSSESGPVTVTERSMR